MNPIVSVCVQTYNHEAYIKECLNGILMQETNFPFEIVLGEDESSDGTREICKEYADKHSNKIKLFLRSRKDVIYIDGNATGRYNLVENLKYSSGKYIALCEGDDYWTDPLKLQKQVDFMEANKEYNICFHEVLVYKQADKSLRKNTITRPVEETTTVQELSKGNYIHTPSVMFRNNFIIPKWFMKVPTGDWALYMIALQGKKIKKFPDTIAVYREHVSGIWSSKSQLQQMKMTKKTFTLVLKNIPLDPISKSNLKRIIQHISKGIRGKGKINLNWKKRLKNKLRPVYYYLKRNIN